MSFARLVRECEELLFFVRLVRENRSASSECRVEKTMQIKSMLCLVTLLAVGFAAHAAEDDNNPCDAVENDVQTMECSTYSRTTAEDLLKDNYASLSERMQATYGKNAAQLADITAKLKTAQQQWLKTRDADCAVEAFPATEGSKAFKIAQNDCVARMSDERSEFLESIGQE